MFDEALDHLRIVSLKNVRNDCWKLRRRMFTDLEFPAESVSLGSSLGSNSEVLWLRPVESAEKRGCPGPVSLFGSCILPQDVLEGQLDDCYLVSALTLLAASPVAVRQLLTDCGEGKVVVNFWTGGHQQQVTVDDRVPCSAATGKPLFAHCHNADGYWVQVVEKAFAKVHGCYVALGGGNTAEALFDMCGCPVFDYNLEAADVKEEINDGHLWLETRQHISSNSLVACASFRSGAAQDPATRKGLMQNHAYSVLAAAELKTQNGGDSIRVLKVRNPWGGHANWTGDYCPGSAKWKGIAAEDRAGKEDDDNTGSFWMLWSDFCVWFNRLHVCDTSVGPAPTAAIPCRVPRSVSAGCTHNPSFWRNPAFVVTALDGSTKATVTVAQRDRRRELKTPTDSQATTAPASLSYAQVGFTVLVPKEGVACDQLALLPGRHTVVGKSRFWNKREVSRVLDLHEQRSVIVVPSSFSGGDHLDFALLLHGHASISPLQPCPIPLPNSMPSPDPALHEVSIKTSWSQADKTAGGGVTLPAFTSNPQFLLKAPSGTRVVLILEQFVSSSTKPHAAAVYALQTGGCRIQGEVPGKSYFQGSPTFTNAQVTCRECMVPDDSGLLLVPCTMKPGLDAAFNLTAVAHQGPLSLLPATGGDVAVLVLKEKEGVIVRKAPAAGRVTKSGKGKVPGSAFAHMMPGMGAFASAKTGVDGLTDVMAALGGPTLGDDVDPTKSLARRSLGAGSLLRTASNNSERGKGSASGRGSQPARASGVGLIKAGSGRGAVALHANGRVANGSKGPSSTQSRSGSGARAGGGTGNMLKNGSARALVGGKALVKGSSSKQR